MMYDFLDNLGAQHYEKMRKRNATKEEIINTCEETYGKKNCHEETYYNSQSEGKEYDEEFWEDYSNNTKEKKNNS